jgi:hypothetical protein
MAPDPNQFFLQQSAREVTDQSNVEPFRQRITPTNIKIPLKAMPSKSAHPNSGYLVQTQQLPQTSEANPESTINTAVILHLSEREYFELLITHLLF